MTQNVDKRPDPKGKIGQTGQDDFDRNREGLYGGLPEARRDLNAPDVKRTEGGPTTKDDFDRNREGLYGGLPEVRQH